MTLTPAQIHRLQYEDGLVPLDTLGSIEALAFDPAADVRLRAELRHALAPIEIPSVVDAVMRRIDGDKLPVKESVEQSSLEPGSVSAAVMGKLGVGEGIGHQVREALTIEAGTPDSVWPGVAAAIGADVGVTVGDLLRSAVEEEAGFRGQGWGRAAPRRWWVPATAGVLIAAAAALLLWVGSNGSSVQDVAEKITAGPVDIEALDVGTANAVRVLDLGKEDPTIILIEEVQAPEGTAQ